MLPYLNKCRADGEQGPGVPSSGAVGVLGGLFMGNPGMKWAALVGREASGCERTGRREGAVWTGLPACGSLLFLGLVFRIPLVVRYFVFCAGGLLGGKGRDTLFLMRASRALAEAAMEAGPVTDAWSSRCSS